MTHSPRRSQGLWCFGDLADQPDHPLAEAEPICSCTDVDGWLMPSSRSQEVSWVLFSCLSALVQVVCKHPYLERLRWFPLVDESGLILCWCCLIHKLSCVACLAFIFNRTVTLSYYSYRKFIISQVSYCVEEKKTWAIQAWLQKVNILQITSCFRDLHSKVTKRDTKAPKRKPQGFILKVHFLQIMQKATAAPSKTRYCLAFCFPGGMGQVPSFSLFVCSFYCYWFYTPALACVVE